MKILVVDDHVLIREAMRNVLKEVDATAAILEAPDGAAALKLIEQHDDLGLVLLDLTLPDRNGLSLLSELRALRPGVSVVVMSAREERADVTRALDLGAMGFIPKSAQRDVMLGALRLVFAGGIYIPPQILARDESATQPGSPGRHGADRRGADGRGGDGRATPAELGLTGRQLAVLALMAQGKSNKEICRALAISEATVKNHVTAILKALRARNRTEAVIAVGELGWDLAALAK